MSQGKSYWNRVSLFYNGIFNKDKAYQKMYTFIKAPLGSEMDVLEVGTATGLVAREICDTVHQVYATDYSEKMIDKAQTIHHKSNIKFSCADVFNLPFQDDTFDAVIASNVLHIIPNPQEALQEIKRVLKKDGLLIAPTFLWDSPKTLKGKIQKTMMLISGIPLESKWNKESYVNFIQENGFEVVNTEIIKTSFELACIVGKNK